MSSAFLPIAASPYGADERGVICCYLFRPGQPAQALDSARVPAWLTEDQRPAGDFIWLHVSLSHAAAQPWLLATGQLDERFFEDIRDSSRATRFERVGEQMFVVLNDVAYDFSFEAGDVSTLWLSVRRGLAISGRTRPLRSVDRLRDAVRRGDTLDSPMALLDHLLQDQADELQRIARAVNERVDDIEDEVLAGKVSARAAELARLRRLMARLQRLLAPEPSALARVLGHAPAWVSPTDAQSLRRTGDEFAAVLRETAALQERVKLLQEESSARVAETNNRTLYLLTMVTVLALPINLVAALLGMNVGGIPLAQNGHGFWWVVGLIVGTTVVLAAVVIRRLAPRR